MVVTLINLAESGGIWAVVIKVAIPLNLTAFALAVVLFIALKSRGRKVSPTIWMENDAFYFIRRRAPTAPISPSSLQAFEC